VSITEQIEQSDRCLSAAELSRLLNVHRLTIYRAAKAGRLRCFYVGQVVRFEPRAVAACAAGALAVIRQGNQRIEHSFTKRETPGASGRRATTKIWRNDNEKRKWVSETTLTKGTLSNHRSLSAGSIWNCYLSLSKGWTRSAKN